jgi:carbamoyl-phosphate synthase large subunit
MTVRIAVSGVGGGVGQSVLKALQGTGYDTVALDGEALATGLYSASAAHLIPYAGDPAFVGRVIEICRAENCRVFFPGLDAELPYLADAREAFRQAGIEPIVSSREVIQMGDDKLLTSQRLAELGLPAPKTVDMSEHLAGKVDLPPFPFILKKRCGGARSRDVYLIADAEQLGRLLASGADVGQHVAQEYIEGDEYTCGSITLDGQCRGTIVMRRILRDGDTFKCFTVDNPVIEETVRRLVSAIKPHGACNVQLRLREGVPYVFEINARCSGTTAARALCGFNEPRMIADYLLQGIEPQYHILHQTILRYWKELVVPDEEVTQMQQRHSFHRPQVRPL